MVVVVVQILVHLCVSSVASLESGAALVLARLVLARQEKRSAREVIVPSQVVQSVSRFPIQELEEMLGSVIRTASDRSAGAASEGLLRGPCCLGCSDCPCGEKWGWRIASAEGRS